MATKHNKLGKLALITKYNLSYEKTQRIGVYAYSDQNMQLIKDKNRKSISRIPIDIIYCMNCSVCMLLGEEQEVDINKYWKIYFDNQVYWMPKESLEIVR